MLIFHFLLVGYVPLLVQRKLTSNPTQSMRCGKYKAHFSGHFCLYSFKTNYLDSN